MTTDPVTYLSFDGHCEAAFKLRKSNRRLMMLRYGDAPAEAGVLQSPETATRIMDGQLREAGDLTPLVQGPHLRRPYEGRWSYKILAASNQRENQHAQLCSSAPRSRHQAG
jgi:hypothetical protein